MKGKKNISVHREARNGYMFIAPWLIGFVALTAIPMVVSFILMFLRWDFLSPPRWVGLANFHSIFSSAITPIAFKNTMIFTVFSTIIGITLQISVANLLAKGIRGHNVFRVIIYIPSLVIGVALGMMMWPVFGNGEFGLLNQILNILGLPNTTNFLAPGVAVWTMVLITIWTIGGGMIIFLAGIKSIDPSFYEAASIDGAGGTRQFFSITLPLCMPVIAFQTIMTMIGGIQVFDYAIALSFRNTSTMGTGNALATLVYFLYRKAFMDFNMGQAAVIGWIIMVISFVLCMFMFRVFKRYDYMEG